MALGKHASAMRSMDKLFKIWTRLDQKHNLYKLVLSRVILRLAAADPIAAQREYESKLDVAGFAATPEVVERLAHRSDSVTVLHEADRMLPRLA